MTTAYGKRPPTGWSVASFSNVGPRSYLCNYKLTVQLNRISVNRFIALVVVVPLGYYRYPSVDVDVDGAVFAEVQKVVDDLMRITAIAGLLKRSGALNAGLLSEAGDWLAHFAIG